ncbi:MAG: diaminopimelate decarboxylase [Deltaproteobacteria bacterium]|nr:diaminopimelate decarboxylase [Deltaproteobacteria bacterium]MCB9788160.1 diaminopimelate decarboxylase [Deltaproteobacteria bacterium]
MDHFTRRDGELWCEDVALSRIAREVGTPTYVYSRATLTRHYRVFEEAWSPVEHLICFAVKACSSLGVLSVLARLGSGFDIVSVGELERVLRAGGQPQRIVFSGVGKRDDEIARALEVGVHCINVESVEELTIVHEVATRLGRIAPISLRINPDVDAGTHPYISTGLRTSKFGIAMADARRAYGVAASLAGLRIVGVDCHIGSQLQDLAPIAEAMRRLLALVDELATDGITVEHLDLGGGLGIRYDQEVPPSPAEYARHLLGELGDRPLRIVLEPGRVIAGNAGVLLMQVLLTKHNEGKRFVVVDAGMNDAIRPALYGAHHGIEPVAAVDSELSPADIVGPVCESGDFFARDRAFPHVTRGALLAMRSVGAYGFAMSSQYNSRPRAAEVLVDGDRYHVIRARESVDDLMKGETVAPEAV